ncbi:hypothetical protein [Umezawaea tangerina]|uniref:PLL-like beta propeller domain-containing protein n=1 Tax=Umezawaea tangerina TaxID=84725 RepID=A0A2T0T707_9PSEU|nr:hypothetical protein [Umezawaea tangerina]PRY41459.1 hypothetical protein CLV43_105217 [Umezawaea tangerina]
MLHKTGSTLRAILLAAAVAGSALLTAGPSAAAQDDFSTMLACEQYANHRTTTRDEMLTRSQSWISARVPYSQGTCYRNAYGQYRTDCSGYVSMIWGARHSYTTSDIDYISHEIPRADLRPGDALNDPGSHVALFLRWADAAKTQPVVREQAGPNGSPTTERTWSAATASAYTPIRYDHVADAATPPPADTADPMYHQIRNANGTWTGFRPLAGYETDLPGDAKDVGIATMADGTAQAVIIGADDVVYHQIRAADGTWSGFRPLAGNGTTAPAKAKRVAVTGMADGRAQLVIIGWDDRIYHQVRDVDGTWSGFQPVNGMNTTTPAAGKDVAIDALPDGSAHLVITGADDVVYHRVRTDAGWTEFRPVAGYQTTAPAKGKRVAVTGMADGRAQLVIIGWDDRIYHQVRNVDGTWTGFQPVNGMNTTTPAAGKDVAIDAHPDGTAQLLVIGADGGVYHRVRTDTGWTEFTPVAGMGTTAGAKGSQVAISAQDDGTAQIMIVGGA